MRSTTLIMILLFPIGANATVLATVNHQNITTEMVALANPDAHSASEREKTLQVLIQRTLLAQEAKKSEIIDLSRVTAALDVQRLNLLAETMVQHYWKQHPIPQPSILEAYAQLLRQMPPIEYRFRYMILPSYAKAERVIGDLRGGANFSVLAAAHSIAPNAPIGGEAGWLPENIVPAPFLHPLLKMKDMEVTGPIPSSDGYVILQKMGERKSPVPPLAKVKAQIETQIRIQELSQYAHMLQSKASVQIKEDPDVQR